MIEAHWVGSGMAEVARQDAKDDLVQPVWTGGGSIARTVGRLYASSGVGGGSGACTATIVGGGSEQCSGLVDQPRVGTRRAYLPE